VDHMLVLAPVQVLVDVQALQGMSVGLSLGLRWSRLFCPSHSSLVLMGFWISLSHACFSE
jgi:hypothetical protein